MSLARRLTSRCESGLGEDAGLRLDCGEHEEAPESERARIWTRFRDAA